MRNLTLITFVGLLVITSPAQDDKAKLKAELKILNQRVLSSIAKTSTSDTGTDQAGTYRRTNSDSKLAKFSGCKLTLSGAMRDRQASDSYYWTVSVPLQHLDLSTTSIRRDQSSIYMDLITVGAKITRKSLSSGKSPINLTERQVSTTKFTNRYRGWLGTDWDPELIAKDLLRAAEICKIL